MEEKIKSHIESLKVLGNTTRTAQYFLDNPTQYKSFLSLIRYHAEELEYWLNKQ